MENSPTINSSFLLEIAGKEQLQSVSKWSRFIGVIFGILGGILLLCIALLLANFDTLMTQIVKLNGIDEETIEMLERGGKYFIALALLFSGIILMMNGFLLFRFGSFGAIYLKNEDENAITESIDYLKKYIYFSFILASLSVVLSLISTFTFFGGSH